MSSSTPAATIRYSIHEHVLPHDAEARELQTGNSRLEFLQMRGLNCRVLPKHRIEDGIEAVRAKLPRMWFAKGRTDDGIKALRNYRADYDSKRKRFLTTPRHDWASNFADSMRYACVSIDATPQVIDDYSDYETDWVL